MFSVPCKSHPTHLLWCFSSPDALDSTKRGEIINTDPKWDSMGLELRCAILSSCVLHLIFELVFLNILSQMEPLDHLLLFDGGSLLWTPSSR